MFNVYKFNRHIDAAPAYLNEKAIGRVLKRWIDSGKVKREEIFITTKLPPIGECTYTSIHSIRWNIIWIITGNRASSVEKYSKQSMADLQLSYIDLYLIHCPFAMPDTDGDFHRDANGDLILDTETNFLDTWKVIRIIISILNSCHIYRYTYINYRNWKNMSRLA